MAVQKTVQDQRRVEIRANMAPPDMEELNQRIAELSNAGTGLSIEATSSSDTGGAKKAT